MTNNQNSLDEILKDLAVRMYFNGRTDVAASSDVGVTPGNLGHAEPIMEMKVADTLAAINKTIMESLPEVATKTALKKMLYDGQIDLPKYHYEIGYTDGVNNVRDILAKKYGRADNE